LLLSACAKSPSSQAEFALGTVCTINLYESGSRQLYSRIFSRIREIDRTMTAHPSKEEVKIAHNNTQMKIWHLLDTEAAETFVSGVVTINEQAGLEPVKIQNDLFEVLKKALYYAELSGGAFDPTIGPLVQLWGIGTDTQRIPGDDEIANALELVNWRDLALDREGGTAFLRRKGMALDLGAIAKGYAGDEAARIAGEAKVNRAIFDLGGNIVTMGWREQKKFWRIGIQNPLSKRGAYIGIVPVYDKSIVTSGVYERYFESGGKRYHHILSTTDGYPVENGLLSVTIVTDSSTAADALSTVVFTLGFKRGKALIDSIPGAGAIFIFDDRTVRITDSLAGIFTLTDDKFRIIP
jgi:thiamine biosynthesis lipoprotein